MKIHQKCPRKFTQNSPKVSTKIHPFCPQKLAFYVHEKSATLNMWYTASSVPLLNTEDAPLRIRRRRHDVAPSQLLSLPITMHEIFSKNMMYHYPGQMTVSGGGVLLLNTNCEFRVKTVPVLSVGQLQLTHRNRVNAPVEFWSTY